jgi:polar amino acid transport system substrate-binding protein
MAILGFSLAACGPSDDSRAEQARKDGAAPASDGSREPREGSAAPLRVGVEAKYPPFESINDKGEFEGFDIELARELGKSLGRPVEFKDLAWDSLIPELQAGRIELICSGMSYTEQRAESIDFSKPYAQSPMSVLLSVTRAKDVTRAEQLDDPQVHIAVQRGTTGEKKAKSAFKKALFKEFDTETDAATEVGTGRSHAFVYDYLSVERHAKRYPDTTRILEASLGSEDYCMAVKKGSPLKATIDAFLDDAKKPGGALGRLMDKWLPGVAEKLKPK